MNTDMSYEYTELAMNIVSQFIISARSYLVLRSQAPGLLCIGGEKTA